jgi:2-polyprenyl-3-methyl-5-hydroxy-6-metoxy-1,4-benzoquinol methylase
VVDLGNTAYSGAFHEGVREGARRSARAVVPIVIELIHPKTVVDVGCSDGAWLSIFREHGLTDVIGLDGEYVNRETLQIPQDQFIAVDLSKSFTLPRTFDLAMTLEVAEHLPLTSAEGFVASLVQLAPVVLFSAAIPFQGGIHHVNEQWPDYWAALFRRHDYVPVDCIRGRVWGSSEIEYWYAQNCLLFVNASTLQQNEVIRLAFDATNAGQMNLVHPRHYLASHQNPEQRGYSVSEAVGILNRSLKNAISRRTRGGEGRK